MEFRKSQKVSEALSLYPVSLKIHQFIVGAMDAR